ncbi:HDOD domain-containing protein [Nocardioides stalactiti]|uniref:HDOD domain-containing protein n=1 Tax=Nocardioides stalactiti TaxID=2755356 RepID=UPI0016027D15|nr:HDOD domain-containing protein [Nocardioides stalactiti]
MTALALDIDTVLDGLDRMASQRPVAARIVATSNSDRTSAVGLANALGADVALAAKVMKLANSAYFGLSGKVTSLQFAVTVVGFNSVRSIATIALANLDDERLLPQGFGELSLHLAAAAGSLGPRFGTRTADGMALGLLAPLGMALLHQTDRHGYDQLVAATELGSQRFAAESIRYGICSPQLSGEALNQWHFPADMVDALRAVASGPEGALLRTSYELTARLVEPHHKKRALERLSDQRITETEASARLTAIRTDVRELRSALGL